MLRLAAGEAAPFGGATEKAKAEVMRFLKGPSAGEALAASPELAAKIKPLLAA